MTWKAFILLIQCAQIIPARLKVGIVGAGNTRQMFRIKT